MNLSLLIEFKGVGRTPFPPLNTPLTYVPFLLPEIWIKLTALDRCRLDVTITLLCRHAFLPATVSVYFNRLDNIAISKNQ